MNSREELRIDRDSSSQHDTAAPIQLVVVHSDAALTAMVLERAVDLIAELNAKVLLIAAQTGPFPQGFHDASLSHARLVEQLANLTFSCPFPVTSRVVMASDWVEGLRSSLPEESIILIGTRNQPQQTPEKLLSRALAADGHQVALLHIA